MPSEKTERAPKRKAHTKSRKGCLQCKQRHTKCNEEHPRCGNCVRLDIHCHWPIVPNSYSTSPQSVPDTPLSTLNGNHQSGPTEIASPSLESQLCIADLRLLHHWSTKGYKSLHPFVPSKHTLWQTDLIEIAFEHPFLLHGLLALSAVHKAASEARADKQSLLLQADSHITRALIPYRSNLQSSNVETAMPMFLLSSTLVTYHLGSAQLERPEDPIAALHHCFRLLKGVQVVTHPHTEKIRSSKMFAQMADLEYVEALDKLSVNDEIPEILQLTEISDLLLDTTDKEACLDAINALHTTFKRLRKLTPDRDEYLIAFLWPAMVPDHFLHLISVHNPVTCVLLAYFAALLASVRPVWWIGEWPERISTATQQLLKGKPELEKWLVWPMQIIAPRLEKNNLG